MLRAAQDLWGLFWTLLHHFNQIQSIPTRIHDKSQFGARRTQVPRVLSSQPNIKYQLEVKCCFNSKREKKYFLVVEFIIFLFQTWVSIIHRYGGKLDSMKSCVWIIKYSLRLALKLRVLLLACQLPYWIHLLPYGRATRLEITSSGNNLCHEFESLSF